MGRGRTVNTEDPQKTLRENRYRSEASRRGGSTEKGLMHGQKVTRPLLLLFATWFTMPRLETSLFFISENTVSFRWPSKDSASKARSKSDSA